jgi:large subunit ribosomal protein L4
VTKRMVAMKCQVKDFNNKAKGQIELNDSVFGIEPRKDILARTVNWQLAKRRSGTHKVKLVGDIRGTTAKPFRQKGTGRARQGSSRATQFRGGATVHGPVVRSHGYKLPKKIRKLALKCALSSKQVDGKLLVLDNFEVSGKTKDLVETIKNLVSNQYSLLMVQIRTPHSPRLLAIYLDVTFCRQLVRTYTIYCGVIT